MSLSQEQALFSADFANLILWANKKPGVRVRIDGTTWVAQTSGTAQNLNSVSFDPVTGIMFVIGDANVLYSLDGLNWTDLGIAGNFLWSELIYDSSRNTWYICSSTGGVGELLSTKRLPF